MPKKRSLSNPVENYLKTLVSEKKINEEDEELSPIVKSLMGSFNVPKDFDFDYKKEKSRWLEQKYL